MNSAAPNVVEYAEIIVPSGCIFVVSVEAIG
jgi:hypothetical protein